MSEEEWDEGEGEKLADRVRSVVQGVARRAFMRGVNEGYERAQGPVDETRIVEGPDQASLALVKARYGYTVRVSSPRGEVVDIPLDLSWGTAKAIQDAIWDVLERVRVAAEVGRLFHQPYGNRHQRAGNELELSFIKRWQDINRTGPNAGSRWGILYYLLAARPSEPHDTDVTQRDATVAATVIRWLGTPVGYGFLMEVLDDHGLVIKKKEEG